MKLASLLFAAVSLIFFHSRMNIPIESNSLAMK